MQEVCQNHSAITITCQNSEPVVVISLEEYNAMRETLYLMRSPKNAQRLIASIQDIERERYTERNLK